MLFTHSFFLVVAGVALVPDIAAQELDALTANGIAGCQGLAALFPHNLFYPSTTTYMNESTRESNRSCRRAVPRQHPTGANLIILPRSLVRNMPALPFMRLCPGKCPGHIRCPESHHQNRDPLFNSQRRPYARARRGFFKQGRYDRHDKYSHPGACPE